MFQDEQIQKFYICYGRHA